MNNVKDAIQRVDKNEISAVSLVNKLLPDGTKQVKVDLTRKLVMPERMESPARSHVFYDAAGFEAFLTANKTNKTIVFADVNDVIVSAVLDDSAEKGFEKVTLRPPYHPVFNLLDKSLLNRTLPIADFAQAVMRNRGVIKDTDGQSAQSIALTMQQITIASETTQFIGDGKAAVNGLITKTKISAGSPEAKTELHIPDSFLVEVPIYLNTKAKVFSVDVTISTKHGDVLAVVDCPELDLKKYEVFEEMMDSIKKADGVVVVYGSPGTSDWKYNR